MKLSETFKCFLLGLVFMPLIVVLDTLAYLLGMKMEDE